jgi:hypothetical protein
MRETEIQFTCDHCGADVVWGRDACPECEWSRHVAYGTDEHPPCGGMMRPVRRTDTRVIRKCECGWLTDTPTEVAHDRLECTPFWNPAIRLGRDGNGRPMRSEFEFWDDGGPEFESWDGVPSLLVSLPPA